MVKALIESGVVPKRLRRIAIAVPGMRNILVHGYAEVRHDIIYETLRTEFDELGALLEALVREAEELDP